ncbi:nitrophenyl compound nitroreductase subunit ArsF family protein [Sunxiuqinia indica]|uniref:nitrophenyl compound nitroreductase subunit ArsF family protein n=1 Tax=Sunxiuqinia indica TaxID=2692584 RepID=UPI00135CD1E5|nr:nitrophenyl compound nitroreductase subunit ArsF family protein [Sunxiuqinia indica]
MKTVFLSLLLMLGVSCFAQTESSAEKQVDTKIEAFYFHNTRRCETCKAVENVSSEALKTMQIQLKSLNIDEDKNMAIAEKVGAGGQALIITNGKKNIDLTNKGFMYARSNPDKLKAAIEKAVKELDNE